MENNKMPSVSLVYDRKKTGGRNKEAVVEIRISYDYRKKYISTGIRVLPKEWHNGMVTGRPDAIELDKALTTLRNKVLKAINEMLEEGCLDVREIPARILCCIYEGYLGYFPYICGYNPNIFQRMSNNKFFSSGVVLGLLVVAIILLLLALSVFIVWGCAYVHWLLASGVGCTLGIVWLLGIAGVMGMVCRTSRRSA